MAALAGGENGVGAGEDARPVRLEAVEGAGRCETFDNALVDGARTDAGGEIGERGEGTLLALLHDQLDRLRADALQRGQRIIDRAVTDLEGRAGAVDIGRFHLDAEPLRLGTE